MSLASPSDDQIFFTLEDLIISVNTHVGPEGYAVVTARSKKSELGIKRKVWLRCDRGGRNRVSRERDRRHINTRIIDCQFKVTALRNGENETWALEVVNSHHNHDASLAESHSALRKLTMIEEIKTDVSRQLTVHTASFKILSTLRVEFDHSNSMIKSRDIYNMKAQMRRDTLSSLTSMQALMQELNQKDWTFNYQKNVRNQITHLFFVRKTSQELLKINHEVLVMNCTYKINRYKLSLLIISGQIALHINFYVAFCFMTQEKQEDYEWTLRQLKRLYAQLLFSDSMIIVIDMKRELMNVARFVFSNTSHLLCLWHINKNVMRNCKRQFDTKKTWETFIFDWNSIVYVSSRIDYETIWQQLNDAYYRTHEECLNYLRDIYILSFHRRFVKFQIDQVLHFETTTISRGEGEHAVLKRHLAVSTDKHFISSSVISNQWIVSDYDYRWSQNRDG